MTNNQKTKFGWKKGCLFTAVGFFALTFFIGVLSGDDKDKNKPQQAKKVSDTAKQAEQVPNELTKPVTPWSYDVRYDEMDDKSTYFAQVPSTNFLNFDFPYNGGSQMFVTIRKAGNSKRVYLKIKTGQFLINSYNNKTIRIKFDEGQTSAYTALTAADGSSDIIFIQNANRFITNIKKASTMMIEAPYYQAGSQVSKFNVKGLDMGELK